MVERRCKNCIIAPLTRDIELRGKVKPGFCDRREDPASSAGRRDERGRDFYDSKSESDAGTSFELFEEEKVRHRSSYPASYCKFRVNDLMDKLIAVSNTMFFMFGCSTRPSAEVSVSSVTAPAFKAIIEKNDPGSVLLDVRTPEEYSRGHIKGAMSIDYFSRDFKARISGLDLTKTYLIYCRSGNRTAKTAQMMQRLGFKRVVALAGGILDWSSNDFPLGK